MKRINNVLLIGVGSTIKEEWAEALISHYKINKAFAVTAVELKKTSIFSVILSFWDVVDGRYDALELLPPLDDNDIDVLNKHCVETMLMVNRQGEKFGGFHERLRLSLNHFRYWKNFLETEKIELVIFGNIPHEVFDFTIYNLCKTKQILHCMCSPVSFFPGRIHGFKDIEEGGYEIGIKFKRLLEDYEKQGIEEIRLNGIAQKIWDEYTENGASGMERTANWNRVYKDYRMDTNRRLFDVDIQREVGHKCKEIKEGNANIKEIIRVALNICRIKKNYFKEVKRTKVLINYYDELAQSPDLDAAYIYYPLHYQPECTSSPMGGGLYAYQILPIEILAYNSPDNVKIYVKEHPCQVSFGRQKEFYSCLSKIPKVIIVPSSYSSYELEKRCIAVASLTGTAGFEAMFFGKPFLMFGHIFYNKLSAAYHIRTNEECRNAIESIIKNPPVIEKKELKLFLKAMEEGSISSDAEAVEFLALISSVMEA